MPKPPGDISQFDKVNYVIDAWAQPCEAPWYIYVSTLKPAALTAFITFITFGLSDVARGYARPIDRQQRRRSGKRKGKVGRIIRKWPEFGNLAGRHLPGSSAVKGINWSDGLRTLWRIDSIAQMFLFWWLVADITVDFAFDWTSLLYETRWCKESSRGRFSWQKTTWEIVTPDVWNEIAYPSKDYQFPFPSWIVTFGIIGLKGATITYSIDWRPQNPDFPPTSYTSRIIDIDTGEVFAVSDETEADEDGRAVNVVTAGLPPSTRYGIQGFAVGHHALAFDGVVIGIEDML